MKNLEEIENELSMLLLTNTEMHKESELKKIRKRIQFLKTCKAFLKSNPSKEFVSTEHGRISKIINTVRERFNTWQSNNPQACAGRNEREQRSFYEKENRIRQLQTQLKTLAFIKN